MIKHPETGWSLDNNYKNIDNTFLSMTRKEKREFAHILQGGTCGKEEEEEEQKLRKHKLSIK